MIRASVPLVELNCLSPGQEETDGRDDRRSRTALPDDMIANLLPFLRSGDTLVEVRSNELPEPVQSLVGDPVDVENDRPPRLAVRPVRHERGGGLEHLANRIDERE